MTKTTYDIKEAILNAALFVSIVFITTLAYNYIQEKLEKRSIRSEAVTAFQVEDILKNGSHLNKVLVEQGAK